MDARLGQVDAIPFQVAHLDWPQAMPEGNQDHGGVPVPVTVLASRLHEPLDLGFGEVLPVLRAIRGAASTLHPLCFSLAIELGQYRFRLPSFEPLTRMSAQWPLNRSRAIRRSEVEQ